MDNATDVDYLGTQGYWICAIVAVFSCVASVLMDKPVMGLIVFAYYFLGGVGVREHSFYAAVMVFLMFVADFFFAPFSIVRIVLTAVLLSNVRATSIASRWKPESEEAAAPPRLNDTFADKFPINFPCGSGPKCVSPSYVFATALFSLYRPRAGPPQSSA